ncbi:MAG TPA: hypothetical protein ENF73_06045 [Proteobacteria bacterium]|nr:hypothetical protein [Pseudomonadota bacterium]
MRSYQRGLTDRDAEALELALSSSATLMGGYDAGAAPEVVELLEEVKLKGRLVLWIGSDLVAILGLTASLVFKNICYFFPAAAIALFVLLLYRPDFGQLRREAL